MYEPISTPPADDAKVSELTTQIENQKAVIAAHQATIAAKDHAYQELQRLLKEEGDLRTQRGQRIFTIGCALEDFFKNGLDRCPDDDNIVFSLGHINELMAECGFDPISRVQEYNVGVNLTLTVDIVVKASSKEEAEEMVENASYWLDTDGDFVSFDAPSYNQTLDIYDISPAGL